MNDSPQARRGRWIVLLKSTLGAPTDGLDADAISADLIATRGRPKQWLRTALQAVSAVRSGQRIRYDAPLPNIEWPHPAADGIAAVSAVWQAYLQWALGDPAARDWLYNAVTRLSPTALKAGPDDNPEPWWASELNILHALQSFVLLAGDETLEASLRRCVDFHLAEIQPDHATNEPWAVHALGLHPDGTITAETLLHAAFVQGGGELTPGAKLIVADAVFALEHASLENAKLPG